MAPITDFCFVYRPHQLINRVVLITLTFRERTGDSSSEKMNARLALEWVSQQHSTQRIISSS